MGTKNPRDVPVWLRSIINVVGFIGVAATLMGKIQYDIGIAILVCVPAYVLWEISPYININRMPWRKPKPSALSRYKTETELTEVNEFICKKDEHDLRAEFDLPDMLRYNIDFAKRNLAPKLVSNDDSAEIDTFFLNGQARIDLRYAQIETINNRAHVEWIPGKIGVVNTSKKYVENRKKLTSLMSSAALPTEVTAALKLFDDAIEKNSALMIESLNQSLEADPRNILEDGVYGSNWYGSARGFYWKRFISLRPRADVVALTVRKAIESKRDSQTLPGTTF